MSCWSNVVSLLVILIIMEWNFYTHTNIAAHFIGEIAHIVQVIAVGGIEKITNTEANTHLRFPYRCGITGIEVNEVVTGGWRFVILLAIVFIGHTGLTHNI